MTDAPGVPIIDVAPLVTGGGDQAAVSYAIGQACRVNGFFYVTGHGVSEQLQRRLDTAAHSFFDLDVELTRGLYRSTPHRVRNTSGRGRLSFPFFFDPGFDARVAPMDLSGALRPEDDETGNNE